MAGDTIPDGGESVEEFILRIKDELFEYVMSDLNKFTVMEAMRLKHVVDAVHDVLVLYRQEAEEA